MRKLNIFVLSTSVMLAFSQMVLGDNIPSFKITIPGKSSEFDKDKALAEINKWREEAIRENYFGFRDKYNNKIIKIEWSDGLAEVAKKRSAEASIYPFHGKLDGSRDDFGEVLAWNANTDDNTTSSVIGGISSFYNEKKVYLANREEYDRKSNTDNLSGDKAVGHFYSLINPDTKYIGLAGYKVNDDYIVENPGSI